MTDDSAMNDRLAALEALLARQDERIAQQDERMARQEAEIEQLRAARAAPQVETVAEPDAETPHGLATRRTLLKLGGAAAVAGVAAGAGALALRSPTAYATVNNWQTTTFTVDAETVVRNGTGYTPPDLLQLALGSGIPYAGLGTQLNANSAALAAYDTTTNHIGVYGTSQTGFGLFGVTDSGTGATGAGLNGTANSTGTGVSGNSQSGIGVQGNGGLYGGVFNGGSAPVVLGTTTSVGAPTTGTHVKGEMSLDLNAVLWICVAGGSPGMWSKVGGTLPGFGGGAINLLPSPIRIFDSRPGQPAPLPTSKGILAGGSTTQIQVTGTTVGGLSVPAGATAVIGNLTVTGPVGAGDLILFPTGTTQPLTSNINYNTGQTVANFAVVGLSAGGAMNLFVHVSSTYALFDVAGFTS